MLRSSNILGHRLLSKNCIISPFSISYLFFLVYLGTEGNTKKQIQKAFQLSDKNKVYRFLKENKKSLNGILEMVNIFYLSDSYQILDSYKVNDLMTVKRVNFVRDKKMIVDKTNALVEKTTNGTIQDFLSEDVITDNNKILMLNAIYFKGSWKYPFDKKFTIKEAFHNSGIVDMMRITKYFRYYEDRDIQYVELPYRKDGVYFSVVLPKDKDRDSKVTPDKLLKYRRKARNTNISLFLPKFTQSCKSDLISGFQNLGVTDLFNLKADLSNISGNKDLYVTKIIHEAFIDVNEEGTKASAATAIAISLKSLSLPKEFKADHPFFYTVSYEDLNIFMGTFDNGSQKGGSHVEKDSGNNIMLFSSLLALLLYGSS
jgi:serpin B